MKVECIKEKLKKRVLQAERITGKNLSLPVLSSIMLIAEKKSLKIPSFASFGIFLARIKSIFS